MIPGSFNFVPWVAGVSGAIGRRNILVEDLYLTVSSDIGIQRGIIGMFPAFVKFKV